MEEELKNWDYLFSGIEDQGGIAEEEKRGIINNWKPLRVKLGEDWLKDEENKWHPLIRTYLFNRAPWSIRWVSEFGFGIISLKDKENFGDIFNRLRSAKEFWGAYYELRIALSLLKSLKSEITFEFLKQSTKNKTPDIKIISEIRPLFMEITKKHESADFTLAHTNFIAINEFLISKILSPNQDLDFFCDIQGQVRGPVLSDSDRKKIIKDCEKMLEKAKVSGFEQFHIPNKVDIYIFKKENKDLVPKVKQVIQSDMPESDEIVKIKRTIRDKAAKFEKYSPGVLLIFDSLLWELKYTESYYKNLADKLEEAVNKFQQISALVIYIETYYTPDEDTFVKTDGNCIATKESDREFLRSRNKVIILNEFADCPLLPTEIDILKAI